MTAARERQKDEFALRRRQMVERQLVPRGIRDPRVLEAMGKIPRHLFVEEALRGTAYSDNALPIGLKQTISQPYIVALMLELLKLEPESRVLEIGTGSGYQTALLGSLAATVHSIERIQSLAGRARTTMRSLGLENIRLRVGDGTAGWPEEAPFDRIIVAAGAPSVPAPLMAQLEVGGRLVIPVGDEKKQTVQVVLRGPSGFRTERYDDCVFVKLIGLDAWAEPPGEVS
ncbi:MAG TPA: protein-L-isoaspartate(D-aspartate) O-methyltransferase [Candidatus Polarisedimenticolia bacterium]|nr:protein-L-isoaspartate(D-aspartate) O-methyltransferase [Candidatus Polarisedimenticolia bacterium]